MSPRSLYPDDRGMSRQDTWAYSHFSPTQGLHLGHPVCLCPCVGSFSAPNCSGPLSSRPRVSFAFCVTGPSLSLCVARASASRTWGPLRCSRISFLRAVSHIRKLLYLPWRSGRACLRQQLLISTQGLERLALAAECGGTAAMARAEPQVTDECRPPCPVFSLQFQRFNPGLLYMLGKSHITKPFPSPFSI